MTDDPREAVGGEATDDPRETVEGTVREATSEPVEGRETTEWPVELRGVTETVVATLGPNELWNLAALGVHAPTRESSGDDSTPADRPTDGPTSVTSGDGESDDPRPATARTWGRTRTWRNFREREAGVIQFVTDPRTFVDAAMTVREEPEPVVPSADAWVRVAVERRASGTSGGTQWVEWTLRPIEAAVRREGVRTINRGFAAVIDATVAASRLDVPSYDTETLLDRLQYFESVVEAAGGPREREAFAAIDDAVGWRDRLTD